MRLPWSRTSSFSLLRCRLKRSIAAKERQYEIAERNGLPVPRTKFVESIEDVLKFSSGASDFPCLVKPSHCREWEQLPAGHPLLDQKIALASTESELEAVYRSI